MPTSYPIGAVAKITGLAIDTIRAWERRYQAVQPERTERGRQYGPQQVDRLLLLAQLVQRGHAIGQIASLSDEALADLLSSRPIPVQLSAPPTDFLGSVISAIEGFNPGAAGRELNRLTALLPPRDVVYSVTLPLMVEVGNRWERGSMTVAHEHLTTQLVRSVLGGMMRLYRPHAPWVKMLFATPAGEFHEFGILAAAMLAASGGIDALYLGPDLPAGEVCDVARRTGAQAVVLGITLPSRRSADEVRSVSRGLPQGTELWLGGEASPSLTTPEIGYPVLHLKDLPAFETECQRLRG